MFSPEVSARAPGYPELELINLDASFAQLRAAAAERPFPPMPLAVLTQVQGFRAEDLPPGAPAEAMSWVWRSSRAELAARSEVQGVREGQRVPMAACQ